MSERKRGVGLQRSRTDPVLAPHFDSRIAILLMLGSGTILLMVAVLTGFGLSDVGAPSRAAWFCSGVAALALILVVKRGVGLSWLSPPLVYSVVFWLFHFGLTFPASLAPVILSRYESWWINWLYYPEAGKAAMVSALFLSCFLVAWAVVWVGRRHTRSPSGGWAGQAPELITCGWLGIGSGLALWAFGVADRGLGVLLRPYAEFFPDHSLFSGSVIVVAFGLALQLGGGRSVHATLRTGLWAFAPIAGLTFFAGARTAPMIGVVILGMVGGLRGVRIGGLRFWSGVVLLLVLIGVVQQARSFGLGQVRQISAQGLVTTPVYGITELGGSLWASAMAVNYIDYGHNALLYGSSYVYPLERIIRRSVGLERGNPEDDPRNIAVHIGRLYGENMGYSVVAEGYANGGVVGVCLVGLAWGWALGLLSTHWSGPYGMCALVAVMMPMLVSIRNGFIFVPGWVLLGLGALAFARYVVRPRM